MSVISKTINVERLQNRLESLAQIGKFGETGVRRLALSSEYKEGLKLVQQWMDELGLKTHIDHFGNLIGRFEGKNPHEPVIMIGSHIDSQPNGGRFDGTIGVIGALEVIQTMIEQHIQPNFPIEVISFCDEEGYRFGTGVFGSRGITGQWTEEELERTDEQGISRKQALIDFGLDPHNIHESEYKPGSIKAFIELHIEQGPVLETNQAPVGIVTGIAGPLWLTVELSGVSGHAGTVPMTLRRDPLVGAAKIMTTFNNIVQQKENTPTVGTVGQINVHPNARAIIPESVHFTIDLRDIDLERRNQYEKQLRHAIHQIATEHQLSYKIYEDSNIFPQSCHTAIIKLMEEEAKNMGLDSTPKLMSGAFHDALIMASVCDIGMIFVRSKDGISHHPDEYSSYEDIAIGTELLYRTVLKLACDS